MIYTSPTIADTVRIDRDIRDLREDDPDLTYRCADDVYATLEAAGLRVLVMDDQAGAAEWFAKLAADIRNSIGTAEWLASPEPDQALAGMTDEVRAVWQRELDRLRWCQAVCVRLRQSVAVAVIAGGA